MPFATTVDSGVAEAQAGSRIVVHLNQARNQTLSWLNHRSKQR